VTGTFERLLAEISSVYLSADRYPPSIEEVEQVPYRGLVEPIPVDPEQEGMVAAVTQMLRRVAAAAARGSVLPPPPPSAVYGVLSGAEMLMRWECLAGRGGEMPSHLPAFTYLATVFYLDCHPALRKSQEVEALVEAAGFETPQGGGP
jgi:hypothetical protein